MKFTLNINPESFKDFEPEDIDRALWIIEFFAPHYQNGMDVEEVAFELDIDDDNRLNPVLEGVRVISWGRKCDNTKFIKSLDRLPLNFDY